MQNFNYFTAINGDTVAHIEIEGDRTISRIRYPDGEVVSGVAANILFENDLKPVCRFDHISFEESNFEERPTDEIPLFENQELLQYDPTTGEHRNAEDDDEE